MRGNCPRCGAPNKANVIVTIRMLNDDGLNRGKSKNRSVSFCGRCAAEVVQRLARQLEQARTS